MLFLRVSKYYKIKVSCNLLSSVLLSDVIFSRVCLCVVFVINVPFWTKYFVMGHVNLH